MLTIRQPDLDCNPLAQMDAAIAVLDARTFTVPIARMLRREQQRAAWRAADPWNTEAAELAAARRIVRAVRVHVARAVARRPLTRQRAPRRVGRVVRSASSADESDSGGGGDPPPDFPPRWREVQRRAAHLDGGAA